MPYAVSTNEIGIVEVVFQGKSRHEDHLKARAEAIHLCHEKGYHCLLADFTDLDMEGTFSTLDLYDFGQSWSKLNPPRPFSVACVLPKEPKHQADIRFACDVASNRGVESGVFRTQEQAREWLLEA